MIELGRSGIFSGVTVCLRGSQSTSDFMGLPGLIADHCRHEQALRILFDWSKVESWRFSKDASTSVQTWLEVGRSIERAAIVHHHRWNRQAAWLGAALRLADSQVQSYRLMGLDKALIWLRAPKDPEQPTHQPMQG
jgi:hypothetical protein